MTDDFVFDVATPLGFRVHTTPNYWLRVTYIKHRPLYGREQDVAATLGNPDEVRRSIDDPDVYLFYKLERPGRYICVVARQLNGDGFLITAYPANYLKEGETVWLR